MDGTTSDSVKPNADQLSGNLGYKDLTYGLSVLSGTSRQCGDAPRRMVGLLEKDRGIGHSPNQAPYVDGMITPLLVSE